MSILHLRRRLDAPPFVVVGHPSIHTYTSEADIDAWLALRLAAFAGERPSVGHWEPQDFHREFIAREGWQRDWLWFSESPERDVIGSVALMIGGRPEAPRAMIHWLMVLPAWRGRGVATQLMNELECAAWEAGFHEVWAEAHSNWHAAVEFYGRRGYRDVRQAP